MDVSKKRSGGNVQSASPKKQKTVSKKSNNSKGKPKDENKPKRPKSAYLHFMDDFRLQMKADNENGGDKSTKIGDVAKAGGAAWSAMTDKEKKPYVEKYQKEKGEYDIKMKGFKPDENKPKRPETAFLIFLKEQRPKLKEDGLTGLDISKRAGAMWREMSDADKKKYVEQQHELKAKYDGNMKEYLKTNPPPPPKPKVKQSKAKVPVESESEDDDDEEEDDDDDDEDEEEEESD